jgi:2'-5' RNA ligase
MLPNVGVVMAESAIIVAVSEAEPLVGELRAQFDSASKLGIPAHITVLYPFLPPERLTQLILEGVHSALAEVQPFDFRLATVGRFPGVVYLAPECSDPFVDLVAKIVQQFPEYPPYGGKFQSVIPHLTVSDCGELQADTVEAQLLALMKAEGPISGRCDALTLIENSSGRWSEKSYIRLGEAFQP